MLMLEGHLRLFMARQGKTRISAESEHAVHAVWQTIGFSTEKVIFFLSGVMIGTRDVYVINWANIGRTIVLYILLHVIRFAVLLLFLP